VPSFLGEVSICKASGLFCAKVRKELAAAKQKHGIGILKNKQQLVEALIRRAAEDALRKWIPYQMKAGSRELFKPKPCRCCCNMPGKGGDEGLETGHL